MEKNYQVSKIYKEERLVPFEVDNQLSWTQNYYELQKFNRANTL